MPKEQLDRIICLFFIVVSGCLVLYSFRQIGRNVEDALVLVGYVTNIAPKEQRSFGYGGEREGERVDVPFQGRDMSNVSFVIFRDDAGSYFIKGQDDEILIHRQRYGRGEATPLSDNDIFEARGPLSRAAFTARMEPETDTLRLRLRTPVFRDLRASSRQSAFTRLVISPQQNPIPLPVDEIFFRTSEVSTPKAYQIWVEPDGLRIKEDEDLARPDYSPAASAAEDAGRTQAGGAPASGGSVGAGVETTPGAPDLLRPGDLRTHGSVEYGFRHYTAALVDALGLSRVTIFGLRFFLAALLVGLALIVAPQARWPFGMTIFGCTLLLVCVGVSLSGRDFFFHPHHPRFQEYLRYLYVSAVILFALRVPFNPDEGGSFARFLRPLGVAYLCFLLAYLLTDDGFNGSTLSIGSLLWSVVMTLAGFAAALAASASLQLLGRLKLGKLAAQVATVNHFRRWLLLPLLLIIVGLIAARFAGGREAVTVFGVRAHLPTLLLPLVIFWTAFLVWTAEAAAEQKVAWLVSAAVLSLLSVLAYKLASGDNGGTMTLAVGVVSVLMLSKSGLRFRLAILLLVLTGAVSLALLSQSARFELAWGGEEGRVLFYDAAKNLRLARDMARAGGVLGNYTNLLIPSEVRSNIHSDLVAAYVIGFFGWLAFAIIAIGYLLFYNHLFVGLYQSLFRGRGEAAAATTEEGSGKDPRRLLLLYGTALALTFALQAMYVVSATLQRHIPLTGLDLQPLSTSAISVLSFFVVLLGSVALIHSFDQTLPE